MKGIFRKTLVVSFVLCLLVCPVLRETGAELVEDDPAAKTELLPSAAEDTAAGEEMGTEETYKAYPALFEAKQKAVLSAGLAGSLTSVKYDVGDHVKKNAVIATVDIGDLALKKKRSELALRHLEVQVRDLTNLKQQGLATNEDLAKSKMEQDVTRTDVDIFRRQIGKSTISAPFNCMVVRRHVQPHEWVTEGQPVVDVVNLDMIRAVANIPAHLAVQLKKDSVHTFFVTDLNAEVSGKVMAVAPEVDERSNTAQVIWTVEKGDTNLLPGMKGEVRIEP
ncbi:MAG: efflux RND transporter periplasmic adaptor subunit [Desulfobacterales bacterium]